MLHGYDEIAELSWLDDDAMPTQATQVAQIPPTTEHDVPEILEVAADGRVGVYVLASTEQGDEVPLMMVVDPDGKPRWSMRPQGSLVALVFSPDGDLFALEDHEDWEVALTRYSPEGEVRWTHTWDETGSNFAVMEGGPDGTLYLGGPAYPSSEGAPGVVMAIRP
jgi:hypothetical protein